MLILYMERALTIKCMTELSGRWDKWRKIVNKKSFSCSIVFYHWTYKTVFSNKNKTIIGFLFTSKV